MTATMTRTETPVLTVEASREVEQRADVNLVEFLASLTPAEQKGYWALNLLEYGYQDEADRPLAFLVAWLDESDDWQCARRGIVDTGFGPEPMEVRAPRVEGWRDHLARAVPWLDRSEPDPEDLKRLPGPHDVPLPGLDAAPLAQRPAVAR